MLTIRQSKFGKSRLVPLHSSAVQAACWLWVAWAFHLQRYAALPGTNAAPRFIGLQTHTGKVAFRNLQIKALWSMRAIVISATLLAAGASFAQTVRFDTDAPGSVPAGWTCGATGSGNPRWTVERDTGAPSAPHVLVQSGAATFPWCVRPDAAVTDGFVEVKLKAISGREDQAGGVVWRWKDGNNYYAARANALENNVALYYMQGGTRKTLKYVDAPSAVGAWHTLRVEFTGTRIVVLFDSKPAIEFEDAHISGSGAVGVWTKADSVTRFDDFNFGSAKKP